MSPTINLRYFPILEKATLRNSPDAANEVAILGLLPIVGMGCYWVHSFTRLGIQDSGLIYKSITINRFIETKGFYPQSNYFLTVIDLQKPYIFFTQNIT